MNIDEKNESMVDDIEVMSNNLIKKMEKACKLMDFLEIPINSLMTIDIDVFYDILMNEEKLRVLVSKLRNKAFW